MSELKLNFNVRRRKSPVRMLIVGHPKIGKTELGAGLENVFIMDLQDGTGYIPDGVPVANIKALALEHDMTELNMFGTVVTQLKKNPPDYLFIDTATEVEGLAKELGLVMYKKNPMGKNFTGTDILTLPQGGGYLWMRNGFDELTNMLEGAYTKGIIYTVHPKNSSISKEGRDLMARDINLTGAMKTIFVGNMDAIGFMYRNKGTNENVLSFKTDERDLATGARPKHLRGQEFVISKLEDNGKLTTYWDKIYID